MTCHFEEKVVVIHGLNGLGKTNLMDSVHQLCLTKSYFKSMEQHNVKFGCALFTLEGVFDDGQVFMGWEEGKGKVIRENGSNQTAKALIGKRPVVMVAPSDTGLILGGSEERRKMMDRFLCQVDSEYLMALTEYQKWLKQRSAILKQISENSPIDPFLLEFTELKMGPLATLIQHRRKGFADALAPDLEEIYKSISGGKELPSMEYQPSEFGPATPQEKASGRNLVGPQADDIEWKLDGFSVKKFASQGQQKSLVFSIKLAQIKRLSQEQSIPPTLLFDDLFEKLDQQRLHRLLEWVQEQNFAQLFITDTQRERSQDLIGGSMDFIGL
jgi:DNA replication and repair protein RecF